MPKTVTASQARATLFDLIDYVARSPGERVVISHRDRKERVALVSESRLRYLEAIADARRREAEKKPFKLIGSIELLCSPEELEQEMREMREMREERIRRAEAKFQDL